MISPINKHCVFGSPLAWLLLFVMGGSLVACQPAPNETSGDHTDSIVVTNITFTEPPFLTGRAIDNSLLRVRVSVNEDSFGLTRNGDSWSGNVSVARGQYVLLKIVWLQDDLELASHTHEIIDIADNFNLNITPDMYDSTQYDWDNDGINNLMELRGDTSPWDFNSPEINNTTASTPAPYETDFDLDGVADSIDNCFSVSNYNQLDIDGDGPGDLCDSVNDLEAELIVPELSQLGIVKLNRNVFVNDIVPTDIPGGMHVSVNLSFSETQEITDPFALDIHTKLLTGDSREILGQLSSNSGEVFTAGQTITYSTGMFIYGRGGTYQIRIDESAPGAAEFSRMQVVDTATIQNPLSVEVNVGQVVLSSPLYIEQSTNEQGGQQFEIVFSMTELLGHPISTKVFLDISSDNGDEYEFLSNSDSWTDNIGTSIFSANQTKWFRMVLGSDSIGAALRPGTYTAQVGAWIYNQINPYRYAAFDFLDINPATNPTDTVDRVSFELQ